MEKGQAKKVGRPKVEVDYEAVERLAGQLCNQKLICEILHLSRDTMSHDKEFQRAYNDGLGSAKRTLLNKQFEMAKNGNQVLLTWLGKNYLEQADKMETKNEDRVTIVIAGDDKDL